MNEQQPNGAELEDTQPHDPVEDETGLEISDQHPDDHDQDEICAGEVVLEEDVEIDESGTFDDDRELREFEPTL